MIPVKCESLPCKANLKNFAKTYYVDSIKSPCPTCSISGNLIACDYIHLVVEDRFGHLESTIDGKKYKFACGRANKLYRMPINTPGFPRSYTKLPSACTCPECLLAFGAEELNGELKVKVG